MMNTKNRFTCAMLVLIDNVMGNMLSLLRSGDRAPFQKGIVDNLSLTYEGNRLIRTEDVSVGSSVPGSMDFRDGAVTQPYRFSGNELYLGNGLGLYDFKARMYDPALGRFTSVDPLAEKYYPLTSYAYCASDPIKYKDPNGMKIVIGSLLDRFLAFLE